MVLEGFAGPSYRSQSITQGSERLVNWYCEKFESGTPKTRTALYPTPGFISFATFAESPIRGLFLAGTRGFAAVGAVLYEIFSDGTKTNRGTIATNANPATFAYSGDSGGQLFITSGGQGYLFVLATNVLTNPVSAVDFAGFMDGFFLALDATTSTFKISGLLDGATWSGSQVVRRSAGSDPWKSMLVSNKEIWLIGDLTSEVWYNAGLSPFPFALNTSSFIEYGTDAAYSAVRVGGIPTWLGKSAQGRGTVLQAVGGYAAPAQIATEPVEFALQGYTTRSDAVAFGYQDQGHDFYVLTLPSANATWCYDNKTQLWHERGYWNTALAAYDAMRGMFHVSAFGKHLVGDRSTGTIYEMKTSYYTEIDGLTTGVRRQRTFPHLNQEHKMLFPSRLELDMETGNALATGQGSDPQVTLTQSVDGGRTFSNEVWATSSGAIGKYTTRVLFNRLNAGRDLVLNIVVSDPVGWRVSMAMMDVEVGTH